MLFYTQISEQYAPFYIKVIVANARYATHVLAFAGSGTTGEAVMQLDAKDGGNRKYILIEEGEGADKYCRTLTAKRLKLAMQTNGYPTGDFQFLKTGQKLDRQAIVSMERDALAGLICQADETGVPPYRDINISS